MRLPTIALIDSSFFGKDQNLRHLYVGGAPIPFSSSVESFVVYGISSQEIERVRMLQKDNIPQWRFFDFADSYIADDEFEAQASEMLAIPLAGWANARTIRNAVDLVIRGSRNGFGTDLSGYFATFENLCRKLWTVSISDQDSLYEMFRFYVMSRFLGEQNVVRNADVVVLLRRQDAQVIKGFLRRLFGESEGKFYFRGGPFSELAEIGLLPTGFLIEELNRRNDPELVFSFYENIRILPELKEYAAAVRDALIPGGERVREYERFLQRMQSLGIEMFDLRIKIPDNAFSLDELYSIILEISKYRDISSILMHLGTTSREVILQRLFQDRLATFQNEFRYFDRASMLLDSTPWGQSLGAPFEPIF